MRKVFLLILVSFGILGNSIGQNDAKTSIANCSKTEIDTLLKHSKEVLYSTPDISYKYASEALECSKKISYNLGIAGAFKLFGSYHCDLSGFYDSAEVFIDSSFIYYKKAGGIAGKEGEGAVWHNKATIFYRKGQYLEALELYMKAALILDSIGNTSVLMLTYNNLSTLYSFYKQPDKALEYSKLFIEIAEKSNNQHMISVSSITHASILIEKGKYEEALPYINKAGEIARSRNDHYILELYYINLSTYACFWEKDYKKAIDLNKKATQEAGILNNKWELLRAGTSLSELYYFDKQYSLAKNQIYKAQLLNKEINSPDIEQRLMKVYGKVLVANGEFKKASNALISAMELQDTVFNQSNQLQMNYYEALYQKTKKESQIKQLLVDKEISDLKLKRRKFVILSLFSFSALILVISFLIFISLRQKKIVIAKNLALEKEKVEKLEKEQQLIATQAVLSGEETERRRLARDLHDGLGGMLSGIKLKLSSIKGNFVLDNESAKSFDNAIESLDASVKEMRRVAHNLMPEVLVKYGLKEAISDFCSGLEIPESKLENKFYGNPDRVDQNIEVAVFRIMQELVNNSIKHSQAEKILVQLVQDDERLSLTVQDNGKGFDMKIMEACKSVGLSSIKSRVKALNGILDIYSMPGKGTEIEIEFRIGK